MGIKQIVHRLVLGYRSSSQAYIEYLRKAGVKLGDNIVIFAPNHTSIDIQQHMLSIGFNVNMTGPVSILTHDYSSIACRKIVGGYRRLRECETCYDWK